jgi:protein-disulfide isomerase
VAPESFGEFHRRLLSVEQADRQSALAVAEELGLPMDEIEAGMEADVVRETVQQSYEIAQALGLSGTPSYVIGEIVEFGAVGYDQLRQGVELTRCGEIAC